MPLARRRNEMNVEVSDLSRIASAQESRLAIADCDMHLGPRSLDELRPFLSSRIQQYIATYGMAHRVAWQDGNPAFPKSAPYAARRDAVPPSGDPPGTDLAFTRAQHLDQFNVQLGLVNPPLPSQNFMNADLGNAMCRALNEWQIEALVRPEPRLRASIVVNYEDPPAAVAEIERCAGTQGYGHILLMSCTTGTSRCASLCAAAGCCRGIGPAIGDACVRLCRSSINVVRLAVILHRGHGRPRARLPGASHQPGD